MGSRKHPSIAFSLLLSSVVYIYCPLTSQNLVQNTALDVKVRSFLNNHSDQWYDLNVPESDGKLLYEIVLKNKYTRALEIGTSTGRSGIWMAWALSKTGGKLITIEIDKSRHEQAVANFKAAGLSDYIEARLADAHDLVKDLEGPFDFVFSDADKEWYTQYFIDIAPKVTVGGCFTAHNVSRPRDGARNRRGGGTSEYARYMQSLKNFDTSFDESGAGLAISYKKSDK
jgi:caffeoyl-CoA O-methyltransferase